MSKSAAQSLIWRVVIDGRRTGPTNYSLPSGSQRNQRYIINPKSNPSLFYKPRAQRQPWSGYLWKVIITTGRETCSGGIMAMNRANWPKTSFELCQAPIKRFDTHSEKMTHLSKAEAHNPSRCNQPLQSHLASKMSSFWAAFEQLIPWILPLTLTPYSSWNSCTQA